jgi:hypothetical protein
MEGNRDPKSAPETQSQKGEADAHLQSAWSLKKPAYYGMAIGPALATRIPISGDATNLVPE